jgi:DNA primase
MSLQAIRYKDGRLPKPEQNWVYGASQIALWGKQGKLGRDFLFNKRSLDIDTTAEFRLGYVPESVNHPFSDRIVMPIFDSGDRLLALSVRPITDDPNLLKEYSKYWNESYPKGEHLYGLNRAKLAILKAGFAILCEGQMDVIAMHSYGLTNTVGVLGGAFTTMQAVLLSRWTDQIVVMFDGDKAGEEHTDRCMEILKIFRNGTNSLLKATAMSIKADDAKDPNEYLKSYGSKKLKFHVQTAMTKANMECPIAWAN